LATSCKNPVILKFKKLKSSKLGSFFNKNILFVSESFFLGIKKCKKIPKIETLVGSWTLNILELSSNVFQKLLSVTVCYEHKKSWSSLITK